MARISTGAILGHAALIFFFAVGSAVAADRTIDGTGNNKQNPDWGSAGVPLVRIAPADYTDGASDPAGHDRPGARAVSNAVCVETGPIPNPALATAMLWQWGQFVDHDIDLTTTSFSEPMPVPVPMGDPFFDPFGTGVEIIPFLRSVFDPVSGTAPGNPRQQLNQITAYIDASNVYGSDPVRATALRAHDGSGRLDTSPGRMLPFNISGHPNAGGPGPDLFLAGDVRANEQVALTALHTLFMREHNRQADRIRHRFPGWSSDRVYRRARTIVGGQMQVITYNEFLPLLLGPDALAPYAGYDASVDPGIANEFSTAAYRLGHSMLNSVLMRIDKKGNTIREGDLALKDAFFDPTRILDEGGIEPLLRGLAAQPAMAVDTRITDGVRNFMFGAPGAGGLDLAALNIQRGRDHGLPDYNALRMALGLPAHATWAGITSDPEIQARLAAAYDSIWDVDAWVGGLAEDPVPGALVGELMFTILQDQFERLRDGDRFWYRKTFKNVALRNLEATTLRILILRNTKIGREMPPDPFVMTP